MRISCSLLLGVAICMTGVHGQPNDDTEILDLMKEHFDGSLKYLFKSFQFQGVMLQRPGMAHTMRVKSDEHWKEGIQYLQKFFQRGGFTNETEFQTYFKFGVNLNKLDDKTTNNGLGDYYLKEMQTLSADTKDFARNIKRLYKTHHMFKDPDWAHFLQEKAEHEYESARKFAIANQNLKQMYSAANRIGLALAFFDESLQ